MAHALNEIHRILVPGGIVADIRPHFPAHERNRRRARRRVFCVVPAQTPAMGTLRQGMAGYRFTDRLVARVLRAGLFHLTARETLDIRRYFRTLAAFDAYVREMWTDSRMTGADRRRLERFLRLHPAARIRVDTPTQLNVMQKPSGKP
jgi:hypothetical protein